MFFDTFIFFLITFISLCSIMGFGIFTNNYIIRDKIEINNQFNFFFLGILFILPLSFVYYLIIGNEQIINITIILTGLFFFIRNVKFNKIKFNFILTFLFFTGLIISKTHEDFTSYHFQHIKELSDGTLKFGLANLDERYFYASIFSYVQSIFRFDYFGLSLIHVPIYTIYLSLIGYLFLEISQQKKSYFCSILLLLIILKFKRLSEFGYDYIGQFILLYIFIEYIWGSKKYSSIQNTKLILIYFSSVLIKITNLYFFPIIFFHFMSQKKIKSLFKYKIIFFSLFLISLTFSGNSLLKTGCLNYLIKETCFKSEKINWAFDYKNIENSKKLTKNWSRGFFHQKKTDYNIQEYNQNFKWISNWFSLHFVGKITPFIFLLILIILILNYLIFKKKITLKKNYLLLLGTSLSLLIWLLNFPQFRFGFAGIAILILLISIFIFGEKISFDKKKFKIAVTLVIIYFNFYNVSRIVDEFKRNDLYKFINFPWFAQFKLEYIKINDYDLIYERSSSSNFFWRSCFNASYICVNHDEDVGFKVDGRFIFISKL